MADKLRKPVCAHVEPALYAQLEELRRATGSESMAALLRRVLHEAAFGCKPAADCRSPDSEGSGIGGDGASP